MGRQRGACSGGTGRRGRRRNCGRLGCNTKPNQTKSGPRLRLVGSLLANCQDPFVSEDIFADVFLTDLLPAVHICTCVLLGDLRRSRKKAVCRRHI